MSRDRYNVTGSLGSGQFGTVHRATHADLGREVALKVLELRHPDHRGYLLAEGRRMAQLRQHPNIVQVLDSGDWDEEHVYLAVELCDGGSLEALCAAGPVDAQRACRLISDASRGLHDLHLQGMLHLDVRPANILLSNNVPKLSDFGLARSSDNARPGSVYAPHAAPELHTLGTGSELSDQYAMAMTLGHLLTAGIYCGGPIPDPVTEKSWKGRPDPTALGLHIPDRLRRVLKKATAFDPAKRYADVEAFKHDLDRATPCVAFLPDGEGTWASVDGCYRITWSSKAGTHVVEFLANGRRRSAEGLSATAESAARSHVRKLVQSIAYG